LIIAAITLAALAAIGIAFKAQRVAAFNPQPDPPGYGLVGITDVQSIRINAVNTAPPGTPPDPCRVVMIFRDANGNPFLNGNGNVIRRVALLNGGESAFLVLNGANLGRDPNGRVHHTARTCVFIKQTKRPEIATVTPCYPTVDVNINATDHSINFVRPGKTSAWPYNHNETFVRDPNDALTPVNLVQLWFAMNKAEQVALDHYQGYS
jgi:hypothetical protein